MYFLIGRDEFRYSHRPSDSYYMLWYSVICILIGLMQSACMHTELKSYPKPQEENLDLGMESNQDTQDMATVINPIGYSCDANNTDDICTGKQCISKEFLATFGLSSSRIEVPNGMCSILNCQADEDCGEQGVCFNTLPLSGLPIKICLAACTHLIDCRWEERYACFATQDFDPMTNDQRVCLPNGLAAEIYCSLEGNTCPEIDGDEINTNEMSKE